MRMLIVNFVSSAIYALLMGLFIISVVYFFTATPENAWLIASSRGFIQCQIVTTVAFTLLIYVLDKLALAVAGSITIRLRLRYAIAFSLIVIAVAVALFLPFATSPIWTSFVTIAVAALCGLLAGYCRGSMVDYFSGGQPTVHA